MNTNILKIIINKPVNEVFEYSTNPQNTPAWVYSIQQEETNESPVRQGTIYKNSNAQGEWSEYVVSEFKENELFTLSQVGGSYHVRYTYTPITDNQTQLEYFEWVDTGELEGAFTIAPLEKLKEIIER
ncbi:MAG: SRPBCC family protein [Weeksellaceae bacterium]